MNWNTAKKFLLTTSLGMVLASGSMAQVVTLNMQDLDIDGPGGPYSQPIVLEAGDTLELLAAGHTSRGSVRIHVQEPEAPNLGPNNRNWDPSRLSGQRYKQDIAFDTSRYYQTFTNQVFYGPCKIQFTGSSQSPSVRPSLTYRINRAAAEAGGGGSGAEAGSSVKIPEGATGDVQVVMESSEDGITWVLAGPGPYPANGTRRQFRLRIINQ